MPPLFSITVNYPPDLENLTLWSKRLFALYMGLGLAGSGLLGTGIWLAAAGKPLPVVIGLCVAGALSCLSTGEVSPLMSEVDNRRYQLISTGRDSFE